MENTIGESMRLREYKNMEDSTPIFIDLSEICAVRSCPKEMVHGRMIDGTRLVAKSGVVFWIEGDFTQEIVNLVEIARNER